MRVWVKRRLLNRLNSNKFDVNWKNKHTDSADGVWEHIADFFYGVNQEKAQEALLDLDRLQVCDSTKYDAFHRLRALAADVFCDKFTEEGVKNIDGSWDIMIQIKGWQINQDVFQLDLKAVYTQY